MRIRYTLAARDDRAEAYRFYRERGIHVARAFDRDLRSALDLLRERPRIGTTFVADLRRKLLDRFPYSVLYRVQKDGILVVALRHDRREPGHWLDSVDEGGE